MTDNSSEIECLFVERTKQLLKDGGIAGVILPSSILSNWGIYTKAREIILQYFDIVAIAELGSNTFMATNTNTVVLFLRRRDNYFAANTKNAVDTFFCTLNDVTINGIETPASKYVAHVWEGLDYADYVTLLQKSPNERVKAHEIYAEYKKKISAKNDAKLYEAILNIEAEKLWYFVLAYPQKVVIVKSGEKDMEKRFLGYEFSNRRGNEGIHAIQKGKNIDECTKLFDADSYDNLEKASTYVYRAFKGDYTSPIAEAIQSHISRIPLTDMFNFKRDSFEKNLSLVAKKKVEFNTKWDKRRLASFCQTNPGKDQLSSLDDSHTVSFIEMSSVSNDGCITYKEDKTIKQLKKGSYTLFQDEDIIIAKITPCMENGKCALARNLTNGLAMGSSEFHVLRTNNDIVINDYLFHLLNRQIVRDFAEQNMTGTSGHRRVPIKWYEDLDIPVPPIDVQKQIIEEIAKVDKSVSGAMLQIDKCESDIESLLSSLNFADSTLNTIAPFATKSIKYSDIESETYITTDNMLQNKLGALPFEGVANISSITEYKPEDILISNIRPYLKKIWFADKEGGCSKDVLVLRSADTSKYLPKYIFYMLRRDAFFDYVMEGKKGIKMPRGNKEDIMKYKIPMPNIDEQKRIIAQIEALELEITKARTLIENAASEKQAILDKYL